MGAIRKSVELEFPRLMVWDTLTNSDDLAAWLMPNDFKPEIGHEFTFQTDPAPGFDGTVHAKVLELDAPERMVISWKAGRLNTTVTFTLSETPKGTRLTLVHDGFVLRQLPTRAILSAGWKRLLTKRLPAYLSTKGGQTNGA